MIDATRSCAPRGAVARSAIALAAGFAFLLGGGAHALAQNAAQEAADTPADTADAAPQSPETAEPASAKPAAADVVVVPPGNQFKKQPRVYGGSKALTFFGGGTFKTKYRKVYNLLANNPNLIAAIKQAPANGSKHSFTINWKSKAPRDLRYLPISTDAVAVEKINIAHKQNSTQVTFKADLYAPKKVPGGIVGGVLVFTDKSGRRVGVLAPMKVLDAQTPTSGSVAD